MINPFHITGLFLLTPKKSENLCFAQWLEMSLGKQSVDLTYLIIRYVVFVFVLTLPVPIPEKVGKLT